jgi:hypothetical protein
MRLRAVAGIVLGLVMVGCSADYVTDSQATVLLVVTSINGGNSSAPILSDVRGDSGTILNCQTDVQLASILKNPRDPGAPSESIVLQRYDVSYVRSDGRAVEGVDVPYRFSAPMTATLAPGDQPTVTIDIVRHQAKLELPLSNITGVDVVEMTANVTFYGQTVSRQNVSASGAATIRFADYVNATTCESSGS